MAAKSKITKKLVDGLTPTGKLYEVRDAEIIGFHVRVTPAGARTYAFQWRDADGVWRREKIGRHGSVTADAARDIAKQWAGVVAGGGDPKPKPKPGDAPAQITMAALYARYMEEHAAFKKQRSQLNDDGYWRNHIVPAMGEILVKDVTRADVAALHLKMRATPTNANRVLEVVRKALNLAEIWKLRPEGSNPCKGVKPYRLKKRKRYMTPAEGPRLGKALGLFDSMGGLDMYFAALVRLTLFTGARKGEWLTARWDDVDWERCVLNLADTKSNEEQELILPPAAVAVLQALPKMLGNPFIIPGKIEGKPLKDTKRPWRRLCNLAGIEGLRLHDTRHSFASFTISGTGNIAMVGGLLRHADPSTTARYAHLLDDPLKAAGHVGASAINDLLNAPVLDNVVRLKK